MPITKGSKRPPFSDKWKENLSKAHLGQSRPCKPETREKIRKSHIGLRPSLDTRKKMSELRIGIKLSEETRKKMSIAKSMENSPQWKGGVTKDPDYRRFNNLRRCCRKKGNGGSHSLEEWKLLKKKFNNTCPCCGISEPIIKLSEDHIIPLSKGGSDSIDNIQPLCLACNMKKHTKIIRYTKYVNAQESK